MQALLRGTFHINASCRGSYLELCLSAAGSYALYVS